MLLDAHAHLADPVFDEDRDEVLARARQAGVGAVITVGETLDDARRILDLADRHTEIRPAAGLYPTRLDLDECAAMETFIRQHAGRLAAVGEVGLDYWKVQEDDGREIQREIFGRMIDLSLELDLPLNVHSRSSGRHAVAFLQERGARRVLMHAFDGRARSALPAVEAGYFFSVPPSIVRSPQKQKLVARLPLECLLLETDSPVLGPDRESRNEPANLVLSLRAVAQIKGVSEEAVAEAVERNAKRLFGVLS